jgi:gliding-associated putative ABC transporter substrate-binding component GldG
MNKKTSLKSQTLVRLAIVLGILILLNIVSIRIFGRLDMTRTKMFTLSDASKELMRSLDDRVTVKAYFTEDLPSPYNNNRRMLLDELNEYRAYARGNLQYDFIDPSGEKGEREAEGQGVSPIQVQVVKNDKFEVKRGFMGVVLQYEDRKEVIPVMQNTANIEYELSSTIKKLVTKQQRRVGFLTGQGEATMTDLSHAQEALRRQYQLTSVDVSKNTPVPDDVAALFVVGPTQRFSEDAKFQIDQYLMRGGKITFLLNKIDANLQAQFGRPLDLNLDDLLAAYGIKVNNDAVRDIQCASVSLMQQQYGFAIQSQVPYPYLPVASDFSSGNMMVKNLQGVVLFFVSSLDTVGTAAKGLQAEILMRSSKQSGRQTGMLAIDPLQHYTKEEFSESGIPLAAVVSGSFSSFYAGKPIPSDTAAGSAPPPASARTSSPATRILVIGDGDFMRDQFTNRDNITFFANMVDYMMDDAGLITIRSKEASNPPLEPVSDGTKKLVKYANLGIPPLLVIGYGLARWRMRKTRKRILEQQMKSMTGNS